MSKGAGAHVTPTRYVRERSLGEGQAGQVALARDTARGGRPVVLKSMRTGADHLIRESFEREFSVMSRLAVCGAPRVLDLTVDDQGQLVIVREFVDGQPLDQVSAHMSASERIALTISICEVVSHLHRAGIVHGDLKPDNILIDPIGQPHVIDFGLSRFIAKRNHDDDRNPSGTTAFMAPELFRGERPGIAADLYALATTAWRLLSGGAFPYADMSFIERSSAPPSPPDDCGDIPAEIFEHLRACLDPDPHHRFANAQELVAALCSAGGLQRESDKRAFVPPRPVGHGDLLAQVERAVSTALTDPEATRIIAVCGPNHSGKSTVLEELRWRLLLRGVSVSQSQQRAAQVVLVDDLDSAPTTAAHAIRERAYASASNENIVPNPVFVVACRPGAGALGVLGTYQGFDVPPLSTSDVSDLCLEVLGMDEGISDVLMERTDGIPGLVVGLLSALANEPSPTAIDAKTVSSRTEAEAYVQLSWLDEEERAALSLFVVLGDLVDVQSTATLLGESAKTIESRLQRLVDKGVCEPKPHRNEVMVGAIRDHYSTEFDSVVSDALKRVELLHESVQKEVWFELLVSIDSEKSVEAAEELLGSDSEGSSGSNAWRRVEILERIAPLVRGGERTRCFARLAESLHDVGAHSMSKDAAEAALQQGADSYPDEYLLALRVAVSNSIELGDYDKANSLLQEWAERRNGTSQGAICHQKARVSLRKGAYESCIQLAEEALADGSLPTDVRVDVMGIAGVSHAYLAHHDSAKALLDEAHSIADAPREQAVILAYKAIVAQRGGALKVAKSLYAKAYELAESSADLGRMATYASNGATVDAQLGNHGAAVEQYKRACRLSQRAGKVASLLYAKANLAHSYAYLGLYEMCRSSLDQLAVEATQAGAAEVLAQVAAQYGDLAAKAGDVELAIVRYDEAFAKYKALARPGKMAETLIDAASVFLDRGSAADISAAAARVAEARELINAHELTAQQMELRLQLARAMGGTGKLDAALGELERLSTELDESEFELQWRVFAARAELHAELGADFLAKKMFQQSMELLESTAMRLPTDWRESFWRDPHRREVRDRLSHKRSGAEAPPSFLSAGIAARTARLLDMIKRLATEHEIDRLLERITDCAVELSGAERGFVLMVGEDGMLEARVARDARSGATDPHVAFSHSIAEAVLIDGQPIVTVDATGDARVSEFMSVHKLMLKSVACLPIRGKSGIVGVLYLEHRLRRGRFEEADIDLLFAFADQAAIAIENARLVTENTVRAQELQVANAQLSAAKSELETVLANRTAQLEDTKRQLEQIRESFASGSGRFGIVGKSDPIRKVFHMIERVSQVNVPAFVHGESGTGKELVARAIHDASPRAEGPFVALNCGAVPESLMESELFGHVKGSFTGADQDRDGVFKRASGGTLFLDEVGDMPMKMQVDLLRVLQDRKVRPIGGSEELAVDVRVISASNKSLSELVETGEFREDLFYRLNVVKIELPPLREREGDLPLLVDHLLSKIAEQESRPRKRLAMDAMAMLQAHPLPGNIRQLEHVLLNAYVMVPGEEIKAEDLSLGKRAGSVSLVPPSEPPPQNVVDHKEGERQRILEALEATSWNRARAAKALGIPRRTFYRRLKEHGILQSEG